METKSEKIDLKEWEELLQEMSFGFPRDRGIAIVAVSYIEKIIKEKLRVFLNKGGKKVQKTLFEKNGAFSTLSSKIDFLYCLGVILPQVYLDLDLLRKIRNDFAHGRPWLDFDDEKIKNRIEELNSYKFIKDNLSQFKIKDIKILNNRAKYQISTTLTIIWLIKDLDKLDFIEANINPNLVEWKKLPSNKRIFDLMGNKTILEIIKVKEFQNILHGKE